MKRNYKAKSKLSFRRTFPIFLWKRCISCGKEFVREWGWKQTWNRMWFGEWEYFTRYLCNNCASSLKEAEKLFAKIPKRTDTLKPDFPDYVKSGLFDPDKENE